MIRVKLIDVYIARSLNFYGSTKIEKLYSETFEKR